MDISAIALGALDRAQATFERSASRLARAAAETEPVDSVDVAAAVVGLLMAREEFAVNVKMLETDRMERRALDILA